jgi:hypothetical protein
MAEREKSIDRLILELKERAKELNCLYQIQEILNKTDLSIDEICSAIIKEMPQGWQYPDICQVRIHLAGKDYSSPDFRESPWALRSNIVVQEENLGTIAIHYLEERPSADEGPFLKEERKLINSISEQMGFYILHQQLRQVFREQLKVKDEKRSEWWVIFDLLKRTDPGLLTRLSRKMINFLGWRGVEEAKQLLYQFGPAYSSGTTTIDKNQPFKQTPIDILKISDQIFSLASRHFPEDDILDLIQNWIKEDRSNFLVSVLVNPASTLAEISSAIERYHLITEQGIELSVSREKWFRVALIRRILSNKRLYIQAGKKFITINDFCDFMHRVIFPKDSHGSLGGKSTGLFLATKVLERASGDAKYLHTVKTPKTWYLTSDSIFYFMNFNNLEDITMQKYKDLSQVIQEYPYIVHIFKSSLFPPDIIKGLSLALDDFGDVPLIVRSSSLMEDQVGTAFAGKYKSLFIANQGTKEERLAALMDAIEEVFASMFGPDPIEYRNQHDLIDYNEEMGILIQEVVGTQVGHYFLPAFAGVAFSKNDFRWSSRIKQEDGLIRIVPGLGTRAVDRLSDDYPVLIAPGSPKLQVNVTMDEMIRYSPQKIDVINLETCSFETIEIRSLLKDYGTDYPLIHQIVSLIKQDHIQQSSILGIDFSNDELVVTFAGLFQNTSFLKQIDTIMHVLQEELNYPVDIEFAHDGKNFYLVQCRRQSYTEATAPAPIPQDIPEDKILFTARRYISNGLIQGITHIVYVDPEKYSKLTQYQDIAMIPRIIGKLNKLLPKRQFILMGPGRWGSRGDIKLGVGVTYSEINNAAMLIEIASTKNGYMPEPSFGTHFFLDLVEASIRYLALYPDDKKCIYNQAFLLDKKNILSELIPENENLSEIIRVIHIPSVMKGHVLQVLMNADLDQAVGVFVEPDKMVSQDSIQAIHD